MTKKEFIKRLEEVGCSTTIGYNAFTHMKLLTCGYIFKNKDYFSYNSILYTFDELEQFLIDKGIVEKPFDAHEYLLEKGFEYIGLPADKLVLIGLEKG